MESFHLEEAILGANGLLVYGGTAYQFDPQGNVAHLLNDNGYADAHLAYDAWGQLMSGTNPTPYGYKAQWGYYTDVETGILLLTHRYLDPATGRFLTRDPIGLEGGVNLYAYVGNGVVVRADPGGLFDSQWCYATCAPLFATEHYPVFIACMDTCVAVNDLCKLNEILKDVVKRKGQCNEPASIVDCYNCPGRGAIFQSNCYQCCGRLGLDESRCQDVCDKWRSEKEGSGKVRRRGRRTATGAMLGGGWQK